MGYDLNRLGLAIFGTFVFVGIAIGLYLMFGKKYDKPTSDKH